MKTKQYQTPTAVVISLASADILTASAGKGLVIGWDEGEDVVTKC